jgi:hypothetical protein
VWNVTVSWGDGSADTTFSQSTSGTIDPTGAHSSHSYGTGGIYTVTFTVTDTANGQSASASFQVIVTFPLVLVGDKDHPGENDVITVAPDPTQSGYVDATLNGQVQVVPAVCLSQVLLNGVLGADTITVNLPFPDIPVSVNGGSGQSAARVPTRSPSAPAAA